MEALQKASSLPTSPARVGKLTGVQAVPMNWHQKKKAIEACGKDVPHDHQTGSNIKVCWGPMMDGMDTAQTEKIRTTKVHITEDPMKRMKR